MNVEAMREHLERLKRDNESLKERLRACRKELASLDFEFNQILPKYHALLLSQGKPETEQKIGHYWSH